MIDYSEYKEPVPYVIKALKKRQDLYLRMDKAFTKYKEAIKRGENPEKPKFEDWELDRYKAWKVYNE